MEPVCTGRHVTCVKNKVMVYNVSGHSVWPLSCPCVRRLCFWGRFLLGRKSGGMPRHHCTTKCITQTLSVPHFQPIPRIYPRFTASLHRLASQPAFTFSLHSLASQPAFTPACFSRICLPFVQNFGLVWRPAMTFLSSPFGGRLGCLGPIDRYARITPSAMTFS